MGLSNRQPPVAPRVAASALARRRRRAVVLTLCMALGGSTARAEDFLARARDAYVDVDYGRCRDDVQRALELPASLSARVDAWRLAGLCAAALGDVDGARMAFKRMLALDMNTRLPDGLSPRFTSAFREAKGSFVEGPPLVLTVAEESIAGGTRTVRLQLTDELELVHAVGWRGAAGSSGGPFRKAALLELELPAEAAITLVAFDAQGGEVARVELAARGAQGGDPGTTPPHAVSPHQHGPGRMSGVATGEEAPFSWVVTGAIAGGIVVVAAVGTGLALALTPPQTVTVTTAVVFP